MLTVSLFQTGMGRGGLRGAGGSHGGPLGFGSRSLTEAVPEKPQGTRNTTKHVSETIGLFVLLLTTGSSPGTVKKL